MINWREIPVRDWRLIHTHLLWLVSAMLLTGLALLFSQGYLQYTTRQLQPLQTRLREAVAAADTAQSEYQAAEQSKARYLELEAKGIIGKEHRLEWVEQLLSNRNAQLMPDLRYRIDPQKPLERAEPSGGSMIYASPMQLQYSVRHEEAFSRAHQSLFAAPGRPVPLNCLINRKTTANETESATGLDVECNYLWLTIAPAPIGLQTEQEEPQ